MTSVPHLVTKLPLERQPQEPSFLSTHIWLLKLTFPRPPPISHLRLLRAWHVLKPETPSCLRLLLQADCFGPAPAPGGGLPLLPALWPLCPRGHQPHAAGPHSAKRLRLDGFSVPSGSGREPACLLRAAQTRAHRAPARPCQDTRGAPSSPLPPRLVAGVLLTRLHPLPTASQDGRAQVACAQGVLSRHLNAPGGV